MDKELKVKWVSALRSGNYKQTSGTYYSQRTGGYCCLGVLACVVAGKEVREAASTTLSADGDGELVDELIKMNDSGRSFAEIADRIEASFADR